MDFSINTMNAKDAYQFSVSMLKTEKHKRLLPILEEIYGSASLGLFACEVIIDDPDHEALLKARGFTITDHPNAHTNTKTISWQLKIN
jgi:hypothetical protein